MKIDWFDEDDEMMLVLGLVFLIAVVAGMIFG